jgi:hypothetical protein
MHTIPQEVHDVVGTYTGSWTSYALDAAGQVIKQAAWTDVMKAEDPVAEHGEAYVTTTDEMTFEGGQIPPMEVSGREGYTLNADGSLGQYFIETYGQTFEMQNLSENVLAYTLSATPQELESLGAVKVVSAQHVLVKVIAFEHGVEAHNISRLTTAEWQDSDDKTHTTQFISLQGQHRRQHA